MGLKKGAWTAEEDQILISFIKKHGHGNWHALPNKAGLMRCGKSCRLRWTNYLRPNIKRGNFSLNEEWTIFQLHHILGNRWSAIASHLPGRTDNEIKNLWNTHLKKRLLQRAVDPVTHGPRGHHVCSCYSHGEQANQRFQSHCCTSKSVKMSFKRKGMNSNESVARQHLQDSTKTLQDQEASNSSPLIQETAHDQNMVNSDQREAGHYSLNTEENNSDSSRVHSTKAMEFVSASAFGLYSTATDKEAQSNCEKLAAVMPFDYIQTGEKIMPAVDYTSLHKSMYTDSLKIILDDNGENSNSSAEYQVNWKPLAGNQQNLDSLRCGEFQEHDKAVYPDGNLAFGSSMLNNNVYFPGHELSLWLAAAEYNRPSDQFVAYSSSKVATVLSGQQQNVKEDQLFVANFSVGQLLEQRDQRTGTGTIMEDKSNIYNDRWPDMNLADQEYCDNLVRQVDQLPFLETLFTIAGQT